MYSCNYVNPQNYCSSIQKNQNYDYQKTFNKNKKNGNGNGNNYKPHYCNSDYSSKENDHEGNGKRRRRTVYDKDYCFNKPNLSCNKLNEMKGKCQEYSKSMKLYESALETTLSLVKILIACGINKCIANSSVNIIVHYFLNFEEIPTKPNHKPKKRLRKEELYDDLRSQCHMARDQAKLTISVVKCAFKAFHRRQENLSKLSFCQFRKLDWCEAANRAILALEGSGAPDTVVECAKQRMQCAFEDYMHRIKEQERSREIGNSVCKCCNEVIEGRDPCEEEEAEPACYSKELRQCAHNYNVMDSLEKSKLKNKLTCDKIPGTDKVVCKDSNGHILLTIDKGEIQYDLEAMIYKYECQKSKIKEQLPDLPQDPCALQFGKRTQKVQVNESDFESDDDRKHEEHHEDHHKEQVGLIHSESHHESHEGSYEGSHHGSHKESHRGSEGSIPSHQPPTPDTPSTPEEAPPAPASESPAPEAEPPTLAPEAAPTPAPEEQPSHEAPAPAAEEIKEETPAEAAPPPAEGEAHREGGGAEKPIIVLQTNFYKFIVSTENIDGKPMKTLDFEISECAEDKFKELSQIDNINVRRGGLLSSFTRKQRFNAARSASDVNIIYLPSKPH